MNDKQRKEIRQQFWDDDYFDGLPNKGELLKHFINEYGKAIERQQQAEIEALKANLEHAHGIGEAGGFIKGHKAALKTKTLTEDEIREVADSVCHTWKKNGVGELYMEDFARAILRKAQKK